MTDAPIRILIVDDHPVVRDGLAAMLATEPGMLVVGTASDAAEALALAARLAPDIAIIDIEMPGTGGIALVAALATDAPNVRPIIFTAFDAGGRILAAIRAGAYSYLLKGSPRQEIFATIRAVHAGRRPLPEAIAERLAGQLAAREPTPIDLTERQMAVLRLVAAGRANKEIARELGISERTVKYHVAGIFDRLGAVNRAEAVAIATRAGLLGRKGEE